MGYKTVVMLIAWWLATTSSLPAFALGQPPIRVLIDGQLLDVDRPPIVVNSRVLVPLRGIFERLGAGVRWDQNTRTVIAMRGTTTVEVMIGRLTARVNDRIVPLDVPAMIVAARTLVPLRFISEALGARVEWVEETRTVRITSITTALPHAPPSVVTFFYVVNQTGREIRVRVTVDGQELFVKVLPATAAPAPGAVPPTQPFPALELKVAVNRDARRLEVQALELGIRRSFDIQGFSRIGSGFRIVITINQIALTQDYYPVR